MNIFKAFYAVLTSPVDFPAEQEEEEKEEYWVDVERVSLLSSLFGSFKPKNHSLSV